jgi:hypothetical protein
MFLFRLIQLTTLDACHFLRSFTCFRNLVTAFIDVWISNTSVLFRQYGSFIYVDLTTPHNSLLVKSELVVCLYPRDPLQIKLKGKVIKSTILFVLIIFTYVCT